MLRWFALLQLATVGALALTGASTAAQQTLVDLRLLDQPRPPAIGWVDIDAELEPAEQAALLQLRSAMTDAQQAALLDWASNLPVGARGQLLGRILVAPGGQQLAFFRFLPILTVEERASLAARSNEIGRGTLEFVLHYLGRSSPEDVRSALFDNRIDKLARSPEFTSLPEKDQARILADQREIDRYWRIVVPIVRGELAPPLFAPWQAQLFKSGLSASPYTPLELRRERDSYGDTLLDFERWHECGGVVIAPGWVLTAAHCIREPRLGPFLENRRVRTGTQSLIRGGTTWRIAAVVRHAGYNPAPKVHDIALLQIVADDLTRAGDNRPLKPVRLPAPGDPPLRPGQTLSLTGWGVTGETALGSRFRDLNGRPKRPTADLLRASLKVVPASACNSNPLFQKSGSTVGAGQVCALGENGSDACQGDSGGPVTRQVAGRVTLVGLVSYGMGCGLRDTPGVYLNVRNYLGWIEAAKRQARSGEVVSWAPARARSR